jgi:hypothetical protein
MSLAETFILAGFHNRLNKDVLMRRLYFFKDAQYQDQYHVDGPTRLPRLIRKKHSNRPFAPRAFSQWEPPLNSKQPKGICCHLSSEQIISRIDARVRLPGNHGPIS